MSDSHLNNDSKDSNNPTDQSIKNSSDNNVKYVESLHNFDIYNQESYPSTQNISSQTNLSASLRDPSSNLLNRGFVPRGLRSIHGTTKRIVDAKNSSRRYDWNKLPSGNSTCLKSVSNYNLINIEIDGQIKQLKYLPSYNHMLPLLDIFYSFNKESKTVDSLIFSKQRLKSSVEVIVNALKTNREASLLSDKILTNPSPDSTLSNNNMIDDSNILLSLSKSSLIQNYTGSFNNNNIFENTKDLTNKNPDRRSEIDIVIHLWHLQLQKFLLQKNSLFYSNEALQSLLKRKSFTRNSLKNNKQKVVPILNVPTSAIKDNVDHLPDNTLDNNISKVFNAVQDQLDDIDILVVRPPLAYLTGLQLAFDEPSLNVVDFQLYSISWISKHLTEDLLINTNGEINKKYSSMIKIVSDESELEVLNKENAHLYMVDCLSKSYHEHYVDIDTDSGENFSVSSGKSDNSYEYLLSMLPPLMKRDSYDSVTHDSYSNSTNTTSNTSVFIPSYVEKANNETKEDSIIPKKKSSIKKSFIVNFFRRKHHVQTQPQTERTKDTQHQQQQVKTQLHRTLSNKQYPSNISATSSSTGHQTNTSINNSNFPLMRAAQSNRSLTSQDSASHQTLWLEEHFCDILNNYKKIEMPTQYYLPTDCRSPLSTNKSPFSSSSSLKDGVENIDKTVRSGKSYNRQYLQLRLPFTDNSIPAIYCPWVWGVLPRKRWHVLAKELFRIVEHEGYVLAVQADLSPTNTNPTDSEFQTALAREKIFDSVAINAIHQNIFIHPTQHLSNIFKEHGFTNIKASTLSLKLGDCETEMGCLNEFACLMAINFTFRQEMDYGEGGNKDPGEIIEQYYKEHWSHIDDHAGTFRISYVVAQKPKKIINI